jgi:hypothetical protein
MFSGSGERFRKQAPHSRGSAIQPMNQGHEQSHFFNGRGQREFAGPLSNTERSYRPPSSMESHGRTQSFGNRGSLGEFHGGRLEGIPNGGTGHEEFGGGFHGDHFAGVPSGGMDHGFNGGFRGGHIEGIPRGGMGHGFNGGFHGGRIEGIPSGGMGHGFSGGFHGGGFRR